MEGNFGLGKETGRNTDETSQACKRPRCLTCQLTRGTKNRELLINGQFCSLDINLKSNDFNVINVAQFKHFESRSDVADSKQQNEQSPICL